METMKAMVVILRYNWRSDITLDASRLFADTQQKTTSNAEGISISHP